MLSFGAFERSTQSTYRIVCGTLSFSESETDPCNVGLIGKKILKNGWDNEKKYPWAESRICVFVRVGEREKINSFEITIIIFKAWLEIKNNVNLLF